jgi:hypothetical protein
MTGDVLDAASELMTTVVLAALSTGEQPSAESASSGPFYLSSVDGAIPA